MIFVCAGIVILSGLCGYFYSNRYVSKVKFCNDLIDFCHFLEVNINFSQDKLPQLFNSFCQNKKSHLIELLKSFSNIKFKTSNFTALKRNDLVFPEFISEQFKIEIYNFLNGLGNVDATSQITSIKNYIEKFKIEQKKSQEEKNKNATLAYKLSIGFGLILAIIIF